MVAHSAARTKQAAPAFDRRGALPPVTDQATQRKPTVPEMAAFLQELFGQQLTALMIERADPTDIGRWARGEANPDPAPARHLRNAFRIARRLRDIESASAVQAWFVGMNPDLNDQAPAAVIAKHPRLVAEAADIFLASG